jgi:hypothetical protein
MAGCRPRGEVAGERSEPAPIRVPCGEVVRTPRGFAGRPDGLDHPPLGGFGGQDRSWPSSIRQHGSRTSAPGGDRPFRRRAVERDTSPASSLRPVSSSPCRRRREKIGHRTAGKAVGLGAPTVIARTRAAARRRGAADRARPGAGPVWHQREVCHADVQVLHGDCQYTGRSDPPATVRGPGPTEPGSAHGT